MGIDVGFDLYPPIAQTDEPMRNKWEWFITQVQWEYEDDPNVVRCSEGKLVFEVGEHPSLPLDCTKFRRFSSKVSGRCYAAEEYIRNVATIAKQHFGNRVYFWSEHGDELNTKYSWEEVYAAREHENM